MEFFSDRKVNQLIDFTLWNSEFRGGETSSFNRLSICPLGDGWVELELYLLTDSLCRYSSYECNTHIADLPNYWGRKLTNLGEGITLWLD